MRITRLAFLELLSESKIIIVKPKSQSQSLLTQSSGPYPHFLNPEPKFRGQGRSTNTYTSRVGMDTSLLPFIVPLDPFPKPTSHRNICPNVKSKTES